MRTDDADGTDRRHDGTDRTADERTTSTADREPPGVASDDDAGAGRDDTTGESDDAADDTDAPELTWFERALVDRPVVRDLVLFAFLAGGYGGGMTLLARVPATWGVGMGVAFAVAWLALMEVWARRRGESMLRSIGEDPYAAVRGEGERR
ncbi:hypothetical protein [Halorubellus salinus]|uniref:hypothetical protein n=1 Tax=Halorubellus salinus TaxID=755309 RepID=UPI001D06ABAE|nr:hypothetical protein [Halorubellus salinus]